MAHFFSSPPASLGPREASDDDWYVAAVYAAAAERGQDDTEQASA